jgi:Holliday junction DNA helicase RuvA
MIGRLTGKIVECTPGHVLLDVGGVGYSMQIPLSTYYTISGRSSDGGVALHVHTHVREDALLLFGFATTDERKAFERLLAISGVGPRMALAVLSGIGAEDLERAVLDGDRDRLERIPGIGRKTAERILLELRDRVERETRQGAHAPSTPGAGSESGGIRADAVSALINLGYTRDRARKAVDGAAESQTEGALSLETVLKAALRTLVR